MVTQRPAARSGTPDAPRPRATVRIAALRGPTAMGLVKLMSDAGRTRCDYRVSISGTPDEIVPQILGREVDIAMVPSNLAAVMHNRTAGQVLAIAVNTLGVLHIVENAHTVHRVTDLRGRTIHATGRGASPEYVLNHILRGNGLEPGRDVRIRWHGEHLEPAQVLASDQDAIAFLPQPFVALVQAQNPSVRIALDLNTEWDRIEPDAGLVTGVAIADRKWAEENPGALADFLAEYEASTRFTNEDPSAATLIAEIGILPDPEVARHAIPASHITCVTGPPMRTQLEGYLRVLFDADPASVGGHLPDAGFYHQP